MIRKADRVSNIPKHHNLWSVTYDCGHEGYIEVKKNEKDPYEGSPAMHENCPNAKVAPKEVAAEVSPVASSSQGEMSDTSSPEFCAKNEMIDVARKLLALANDRIAKANALKTAGPVHGAAQVDIVCDQIAAYHGENPANAEQTTLEFYYLGTDGDLREHVTEECFRGTDDTNRRLSGYYAVEAYVQPAAAASKLTKSWIAVVREDNRTLGREAQAFGHGELAIGFANAAAACFAAARSV